MSTTHSLRPTKDWCRAHSAQPMVGDLDPRKAAKARQRMLASKRPTQLRKQP